MQRAIEWAAGAGDDTEADAGLVFEEFTEMQQIGANNITVNLPAGTAQDDLLVAAVATDGNQSTSLSAPAGWNVIVVAQRSSRVTLGVWWKIASASESSSYNFNWTNNEDAYGWIMRFTGHDPGNPIQSNGSNLATGSTPTAPAVTTTSDGCLILRIGGFDDDDITFGDAGMTGHTTITSNKSQESFISSTSGAAAYVPQATAGDSGTANFTLTASEEHVTATIAIAPDANP